MNEENKQMLAGQAQATPEPTPSEPVKRLGILGKLKKCCSKRNLLILLIVAIIVAGAWALKTYVFKGAPKQIYQVAIQVRDQYNADPVEDRRNSLKKGDVLVIQDEDHRWSTTENKSYLVLKMLLTEEQVQKLTVAEEREIPESELSGEERQRIEEEKQRARDEDREYVEEPRTETLRMRMYYIDLGREEFAGFKWQDLLTAQPYSNLLFDWKIVEEKISVEKELKQKK